MMFGLQKWQEVRQSFAHTPAAVRLVWQTSRTATLTLGLLTLGGALLPATQAWVGKLIVDGVVAAIQNGSDPARTQTVFLLPDFRIDSVSCSAPGLIRRAG